MVHFCKLLSKSRYSLIAVGAGIGLLALSACSDDSDRFTSLNYENDSAEIRRAKQLVYAALDQRSEVLFRDIKIFETRNPDVDVVCGWIKILESSNEVSKEVPFVLIGEEFSPSQSKGFCRSKPMQFFEKRSHEIFEEHRSDFSDTIDQIDSTVASYSIALKTLADRWDSCWSNWSVTVVTEASRQGVDGHRLMATLVLPIINPFHESLEALPNAISTSNSWSDSRRIEEFSRYLSVVRDEFSFASQPACRRFLNDAELAAASIENLDEILESAAEKYVSDVEQALERDEVPFLLVPEGDEKAVLEAVRDRGGL